MTGYVPLYIDVGHLRVVVFGGGSVGFRRARLFADKGAKVVIVSKEFSDDVLELANRNCNVKLVKLDVMEDTELAYRIMEDSDLVVIATSDQNANDILASKALSLGKLVNNATEASKGNVIVPFHEEINGLHVTITSLGRTGIAARRALEKVKTILSNDIEIRTLYEVMSMVKEYMKTNIGDVRIRLKLYFEIEQDSEFRRYILSGDLEKAYARAIEIITRYKDG